MPTFMDISRVRYVCLQQAPEPIESQKTVENHEQVLISDLLGSKAN